MTGKIQSLKFTTSRTDTGSFMIRDYQRLSQEPPGNRKLWTRRWVAWTSGWWWSMRRTNGSQTKPPTIRNYLKEFGKEFLEEWEGRFGESCWMLINCGIKMKESMRRWGETFDILLRLLFLEHFLLRLRGRSHSKEVRQIDLDVNRTYRDHIMFRERYNIKQKDLFHVLTAYSMYNTEVLLFFC